MENPHRVLPVDHRDNWGRGGVLVNQFRLTNTYCIIDVNKFVISKFS